MSLRARLILSASIVFIVVALALTAVGLIFREQTIWQIDSELVNSSLFRDQATDTDADFEFLPDAELVAAAEVEVVGTYAASVELPSLDVLSEDLFFLDDRPDLDQIDFSSGKFHDFPFPDSPFQTVPGRSTDSEFRVYVAFAYDPDGSLSQPLTATVDGVSLDETNAFIRQFLFSLLAVAAVVGTILFLMTWWVIRLGVLPVNRLTETAGAVAAGDREARVAEVNRRTEAGRLSVAFNEMLDQRDLAEDRLRQFVADASHELRTPLTSVGGFLEVLSQGDHDEELRSGLLRRMTVETNRMKDLVEDLLLLAQLDEGRPLRTDPVDLGRIAYDAVSDAAVIHPERALSVLIEDEPVRLDPGNVPDFAAIDNALGDDFRIRQVVAGLLQNAVTHTPHDAAITVAVNGVDSGWVELSIADDGPGMTEELAAVAFDRFSRGESSRARVSNKGGFGLGLSIARSIIEANGGDLSLQTAPGDGCVFTIKLPSA